MTLKKFLDADPGDFGRLFAEIKSGQIQDLAQEADRMTQKAARIAAYLEARGADGCGDSGHESAIEQGKKRVQAVRRVMGFVCP